MTTIPAGLRLEREQVRDALASALPWSPHDFVRGRAFAEADRALHAQFLTRELDEADDLRWIAPLPGGGRAAVFVERLPWDSQFFGYGVARINGIFPLERRSSPHTPDYAPLLGAVLDEARRRGIRYCFAAVDARDLPLLRATGSRGFALIETRCIYHRSLRDFEPATRYPCRAATVADVDTLSLVAQERANPHDRFHADPFIDAGDADRLMRAWVEASITGSFADVTIVPDVPRPRAFCTVRYHREHWPHWGVNLGQPVFSAVARELQGWYLRIISECCCHLKSVGAEHCYLATQISNRSVIRVWESLGFSLGRGENILRIIL